MVVGFVFSFAGNTICGLFWLCIGLSELLLFWGYVATWFYCLVYCLVWGGLLLVLGFALSLCCIYIVYLIIV